MHRLRKQQNRSANTIRLARFKSYPVTSFPSQRGCAGSRDSHGPTFTMLISPANLGGIDSRAEPHPADSSERIQKGSRSYNWRLGSETLQKKLLTMHRLPILPFAGVLGFRKALPFLSGMRETRGD